jgi:hypothetical protein
VVNNVKARNNYFNFRVKKLTKPYQVDTGGGRGEFPLTDSQKEQILQYIKLRAKA